MKKTIIYLLGAILMLASCTIQEIFPDRVKSDQEGTVTFSFAVTTPDMQQTRAFEEHDVPSIAHLYVAVFGEAGWKQEYVEAQCDEGYPSTNGESGKKQYKVTLTILNEPCHIHFLAFPDDGLDHSDIPFGPEEEVLAQMKTENENVAYWRMIDAPKGITYKDKAAQVKELNDDTRARMTNVELIRNFAKYTISSAETSGFTLQSAKVVNVPSCGYVPAYNKRTGKFAIDFSSYNSLQVQNYIAADPVGCTLLTPATEGFALKNAVSGIVTDYSYERELPISNPVCLIVYGQYEGSDYYYRIDLTLSDDNSKHYAIFRNFNYTVQINAIRSKGYSTAQEAYEHGSSGDISADVRYEDLNTISNGFSRLDVQFTEATVLSHAEGDPSALTFKLRFLPDIKSDTPDNTKLSIIVDAASAAGAAFQNQSESWNTYLHGTPDVDAEGFSTITIQPNKASSVRLTQSFTVKGVTESGVSIQRTVTIIVLPLQEIKLSPIAKIGEETGQSVDFYISLPKGLPVSIFPLELNIEAEQNSITPVPGENLTVTSGKSLFSADKPGYQFVRTVSYEEYSSAANDPANSGFVMLSDPCNFKTSYAGSSSAIKVSGEYFKDGDTSYKSAALLKFGSISATSVPYGTTGTSTLSFTMIEVAPVTITLTNGIYNGETTFTYTPTATGTQTITDIKPTETGRKIGIALSAEGYAAASATAKRTFALTISNIADSGITNESFGVTGETGTQTLIATINGSDIVSNPSTLNIGVDVTRIKTSGGSSSDESIEAPSISVKADGGSGKKFNCTISDYDSSKYNYYYSSSDNAISGTSITSKTTLNIEKNSTIYLYVTPKDQSATNVKPAMLKIFNNKGKAEVTEIQDGSYTHSEPATYTSSFSQSDPVNVTLTGELTGDETITIKYGNYSKTIPLSDFMSAAGPAVSNEDYGNGTDIP